MRSAKHWKILGDKKQRFIVMIASSRMCRADTLHGLCGKPAETVITGVDGGEQLCVCKDCRKQLASRTPYEKGIATKEFKAKQSSLFDE